MADAPCLTNSGKGRVSRARERNRTILSPVMSLGRLSYTPFVYEEIPARVRSAGEKGPSFECDLCGQSFEGQPAGSGLLIWSRGSERRFEEPPLCEECAARVTAGALYQWAIDEEE
jgi:hypothetical protein